MTASAEDPLPRATCCVTGRCVHLAPWVLPRQEAPLLTGGDCLRNTFSPNGLLAAQSVVPSRWVFISREGKMTPATLTHKAGCWPRTAGSPSLAGSSWPRPVPEDSRRPGGGAEAAFGELKAHIASSGSNLPGPGLWARWCTPPSVEEPRPEAGGGGVQASWFEALEAPCIIEHRNSAF